MITCFDDLHVNDIFELRIPFHDVLLQETVEFSSELDVDGSSTNDDEVEKLFLLLHGYIWI
mgnify:CR=1 FL=1